MLLFWLLWDDCPPSVLSLCCFSSPLRLNFSPSHYPFPVSLLGLRSAFSIRITVILLYFWSAGFGCFLWLCVCLTILFYVSTVHILKPRYFLNNASARSLPEHLILAVSSFPFTMQCALFISFTLIFFSGILVLSESSVFVPHQWINSLYSTQAICGGH